MIHIFRKHSQWLMITITIGVIFAFIFLYNQTQFEKIGTGTIATIYGHSLAREDFQRYERQAQLAQALGLDEVLNFGMSQRGFVPEAFTVNSLVLEHAADELGIQPTAVEVFRTVQALPVFQTNNAYDSTKYQQLISTVLPSLGLTDEAIEKLVRQQLAIQKMKALVGSTTPASPTQFRQLYTAQYQKVEVAFLRYRLADFVSAVKLTDDEIKKAYEDRKAGLKSAEQRRVDYVVFGLTDAQKKLTGKERTDALQAIADQAQAFSQSLVEKNAQFAAVAAQKGAKVETTTPFSAENPPATFADVPDAPEAIFALTKEEPNSDILQTPTAFYVLHLAEIVPSQPLTFEQAKADLTKSLTNEKAQAELSRQGAADHAKLEDALKKNPSFTEAAILVGKKLETPPAFSQAEPPLDPVQVNPAIVNKSATLGEGQLSAFTPSSEGGFILRVNKRLPISEADFAKEEAKLLPGFEQQQQSMVFDDWLEGQIKAAHYQSHARS